MDAFTLHWRQDEPPLECAVLPFAVRIASVRPEAVPAQLHAVLEAMMFREPRLFSVSRTGEEYSLIFDAESIPDFIGPHAEGVVLLEEEYAGVQVMEGDSALSQVGVINRVTAGLAAVDVSTLYVSTYATDLILVPRYALGDALGLLHAQSEAVLSGAPGPVGTPPPAQPPTAASTSLHLSPIPGSLRVMRAPRALRAPLAFAAMRALFFPHTTPGLVDARSPSHRAAYCAWIECGDEITVVLPVALWPAFRDSAAAGGVGVHVADASAGAGADSGGGATGGVGDGEASGGGAREGSEGGDGAAAAGAAASSPQHRALVVHDVEWAAIHVAKGAVPLSDSLLISSLARGLAHANVPIFYQSAFSHDYVLLAKREAWAAVRSLSETMPTAVEFEGGPEAFLSSIAGCG